MALVTPTHLTFYFSVSCCFRETLLGPHKLQLGPSMTHLNMGKRNRKALRKCECACDMMNNTILENNDTMKGGVKKGHYSPGFNLSM